MVVILENIVLGVERAIVVCLVAHDFLITIKTNINTWKTPVNHVQYVALVHHKQSLVP